MKVLKKNKIIKYYLFIFILIIVPSILYNYSPTSNVTLDSFNNKVEETKINNINISWWFFTVLITAIVTYILQNKLAKNKLQLDRLDKRASFIKSVAKDLSDLVNCRLYAVKVYCDGLSSFGGVSSSTREHYRKSVSEWNNKIHSIYSSLNMYDIVGLSTEIEFHIHRNFVKIHSLFVNNIDKSNIDPSIIDEIKILIHQISNNTSSYSRAISEISDASWDKPLDKTEPLTQDNLEIASNITLIKKLFNFKRSSLRVNRSIYKD
ncbi:TPA: hypothetical protein VEO38_003117 [Providencia alcalifaciens]|nr:hypothetical protein [Providencia alcalifaciens]